MESNVNIVETVLNYRQWNGLQKTSDVKSKVWGKSSSLIVFDESWSKLYYEIN